MATHRTWHARTIAALMALALGALPGPGRAGTSDPSGVSDLLLPAAIILAPVIVPLNFLFGDKTPNLIISAQKKADAVLAGQKTTIPFDGLYTGGLDLSQAMEGMFVDGQVPFIEMDTAGSKWLIEQSASPQSLVGQALENPYIRLELAQEGHPACFVWKSDSSNWTRKMPVRPGSCLSVTFGKTLSSDVQLKVNTSRAEQGELLWEFSARQTGKLLLALPYWQGQMEDKTPRITPRHNPVRGQDDYTRFAAGIRTFSAASRPVAADGRPYVLAAKYYSPPHASTYPYVFMSNYAPPQSVAAQVKAVDKLWPAYKPVSESWANAYHRAYETGDVTLVWGRYLVFPKENAVGRVRIESFDFAVLSQNMLFNIRGRSGSMAPVVSGTLLNGQTIWSVKAQPATLPEQFIDTQNCTFRTEAVELTDQDLVLKGNISCPNVAAAGTEWVISRNLLPPVPRID